MSCKQGLTMSVNQSLRAGICAAILVLLAGCLTPIEGLQKSQFDGRVQDIEKSLANGDSKGFKLVRDTPKFIERQFAPWFKQNAHRFPPEYLYGFAARYQKFGDNQEAAFWYLVARSRYLYDLSRCTDKSVMDRLYLMGQGFRPTLTYLVEHPAATGQIGERALAWDASTPLHTMLPLKTCTMGLKGWERTDFSKARRVERKAGYVGGNKTTMYVFPDVKVENVSEWIVPESEFPRIRKETQDIMKEAVSQLANPTKK